MAKSNATKQWQQRLEEQRQRERAQAARQAELDRRAEEERERQREEERRAESLRQAQEFADALEAERVRRDALRARLRAEKLRETREQRQSRQRHDAFLTVLREARRQLAEEAEKPPPARDRAAPSGGQARPAARERREPLGPPAGQSDTSTSVAGATQRNGARASERRNANVQRQRNEATNAARRAAVRDERSEGRRQAARVADAQEGLRAERRGEQRDDARQASRVAEAQASQRAERRAEQRDDSRQASRAAEAQAELRAERRAEQRDDARQASRVAEAQADLRTERRAEQRDAARQVARETIRAERVPTERRAQEPAASAPVLQDRIPSGALSGSLPWLRTAGRSMTTLEGIGVVLRGISLRGVDPTLPDGELQLDEALAWGPTVLRVAINRSHVLDGSDRLSALDYLEAIDAIVARAAQAGAYTMLSLCRLDEDTVFGTTKGTAGTAQPNFIAPQPDYDCIGMWRLLAERYASEPAVLFDLYTAPHAPLPDDLSGMVTDWDLWPLWSRLAIAAMRAVHPRALVVVAGLDWGTDLGGFPLTTIEGSAIPNLVYAARIEPGRSPSLPMLRDLARRHPVFVTEWRGGAGDALRGEVAASMLRAEGIGWAAAHGIGDSALVRRRGATLEPTRFGAVVRRALAVVGEPQARPAPGFAAALL